MDGQNGRWAPGLPTSEMYAVVMIAQRPGPGKHRVQGLARIVHVTWRDPQHASSDHERGARSGNPAPAPTQWRTILVQHILHSRTDEFR